MEPALEFLDDSSLNRRADRSSAGTGTRHRARGARVTICVLTYGEYPDLACRALGSIANHCRRGDYRLVVGANAVGRETLRILRRAAREGLIDRLVVSGRNLSKCPMMRRMFEGVVTRLIWWFDDDSFITEGGALQFWLDRVRTSPVRTVLWGQQAVCWEPSDFIDVRDIHAFIRGAGWYRGLPSPSWRPGGKGEFNFQGCGLGDGRWQFILGGCWMVRTRAVRALDWPDRRLGRLGDDVLLAEAIRQRGWHIDNIGTPGVRMNTEPRRGA
jgi:hypothetical protein